jgi:hypothetical protein
MIDKDKYRIIPRHIEVEKQIYTILKQANQPIYLADVIIGLNSLYDSLKQLQPSDVSIREALWSLIEDGAIQIEDDRKLRLIRLVWIE